MEESNSKIDDRYICQMIDFSPLLVIILDTNLNIKALNFRLAKLLSGDEHNRNNLIGKFWLDFVDESDKYLVEKIHKSLIGKNQLHTELIHSIKDFEGNLITAQWYNSYINSDLRWVFSVGIQEIKKVNPITNIEEAREYYTQELKKDRELINTIKQISLKYTDTNNKKEEAA